MLEYIPTLGFVRNLWNLPLCVVSLFAMNCSTARLCTTLQLNPFLIIDVHQCCTSKSWSRKAFFDSLLMAMVARLRSTSPAVKAQAAAYLHARVNKGWAKFFVLEICWDDMERQAFGEISSCWPCNFLGCDCKMPGKAWYNISIWLYMYTYIYIFLVL